jgi:predicted N-acetyltransferase YhbS
MKLSIRHARLSDAEDIAGLLEQLGYPTDSKAVERRLNLAGSSRDDAVLVAEEEDRVVAFLSLHVIPYFTTGRRVGRVSALSVEESCRGQGIGREMMKAAEEQAKGMGCSAIEVTSANHRIGAHAFYDRLGYPKTSAKFFKPLDEEA